MGPRLRGLKALVHDAVDATVGLVGEGHGSAGRLAMRVLANIPEIAEAAQAADAIRDVSTRGVLGAIRAVNRGVELASDRAIDLAADDGGGDEAPVVMRSDATGTAAWAADAALGALNGVVGDHLHRRGNRLDLGMSLRVGSAYARLDGPSGALDVPGARGRLCVLVHGLAATEWSFCMNALAYHGDAAAHFGSMLERDLDLVPVFVRYNSGRHVSENGRLLSDRLEALVAAWPVPVEDLVIVGHSMGGLVARSACHYARLDGRAWLGRLRSVVCLGSPHQGAPLAKLGHALTSALAAVDLPGTLIPARILDARSDGIKDLGEGLLVDEDWLEPDADALAEAGRREVPLLDDVAYTFLSATVTRDPEHPVGRLLGDLLVRVPSAEGPAIARRGFPIDTRRFGGVLHHQLQNHPDVYARVRDACAARLGAASGSPSGG